MTQHLAEEQNILFIIVYYYLFIIFLFIIIDFILFYFEGGWGPEAGKGCGLNPHPVEGGWDDRDPEQIPGQERWSEVPPAGGMGEE